MMKLNAILLLIPLALVPIFTLQAQELPIAGTWKIISFQIIGYPALQTQEAENWINRTIQFSEQNATLYDQQGKSHHCSQMNYQVSTEDAEAYFLIGYEVKPHRLGIIEDSILLIRINCPATSWLGESREFIKINAEQLIANWDGVFFFLVKQADKKALTATTQQKLMVTPQSVGLLNPNSAFNKNTLVAALPLSYQIKKMTQTGHEGEIIDARYEAYQKDKLMMIIHPNEQRTQIARIHIFDPQAQAPGETHLGMSYAEVFKQEQQPIDCQAGIDERSGQTLCAFKNMETIRYVFEPKKVNTDKTELSPIETLRRAPLVELIWHAAPALMTEAAETPNKTIPKTDDEPKTTADKPETTETPTSTPEVAGVLEPSELPPVVRTEVNEPVVDNVQADEASQTANSAINMPAEILAPADSLPEDMEAIYQQHDQRLNKLYGNLIHQLTQTQPSSDNDKVLSHGSPVSLTYFTAAQRQWLSYRNNNCQWYATLAKASKANQALLACQASMTQKRADEIQRILDLLIQKPAINKPE
ncbi:MAG: lysozyme inhibitor LprI family protein [Pseudomonadota bacterium]|nr:lysozyme inhibitor LprI family protein [Pseudomonadota bacterium]